MIIYSAGRIDCQSIILNFKSDDSNYTTRYYVIVLDKSKEIGKGCIENDECQSGVCYLRRCFSNSTILSHTLFRVDK